MLLEMYNVYLKSQTKNFKWYSSFLALYFPSFIFLPYLDDLLHSFYSIGRRPIQPVQVAGCLEVQIVKAIVIA